MEITKPRYYDRFRCIAAQCPDSCCKEWAVQVDDRSAAKYRALPGPLGDRLRRALAQEDGETVLAIENGRCPMWRQDGLCQIQMELGEEGLCQVCRSYPRLRHDYGDFVELGLELSCPEAARLILETPAEPPVRIQQPGGDEAGYDRDAMDCLRASRARALEILDDSTYSPGQALALLLLYGCQAQEALDGAEEVEFLPEDALETGMELAGPFDLPEFFSFFTSLEILTQKWVALLRQPHRLALPPRTRALARYLVERYWLQAVADYDLTCRVKFIIIACLLVGALGGDYLQTAQLFSKEIENDAGNVDAILDAAYTCPAFTDSRLLGMLLRREI